MRILHIVPASPFGGAQRLAVHMVERQRAQGVDAWLAFLNMGEQAAAAAREADVPLVIGMMSADPRLGRIVSLRRVLAGGGFDVVHLHIPPSWLPAVLPRRRTFALVTHLHVRPAMQVHVRTLRRRLESIGTQQILRASDMLIAISNWVQVAWHNAYPAVATPSRTIYNGIPLPPAAPRGGQANGRDGFVVGVASRLSDRKGIEEFLSLAGRIHKLAPEARFRIAGEGPQRAAYEGLVSSFGLENVLTFEGFVNDMPSFWKGVDLCAFTAPFEPFGLRLIEPISHGVPVVAFSNGSGSDEVVLLCRGIEAVPYGETEKLAEIAVALGRTPERREALARAGYEDIVKRFSMDVMVDQIAEAYEAAGAACRRAK